MRRNPPSCTESLGSIQSLGIDPQSVQHFAFRGGGGWCEIQRGGGRIQRSQNHLGVEPLGPPKSSMLIGFVFPYFHHPFWGFSHYFWKHPYMGIFGNPQNGWWKINGKPNPYEQMGWFGGFSPYFWVETPMYNWTNPPDFLRGQKPTITIGIY